MSDAILTAPVTPVTALGNAFHDGGVKIAETGPYGMVVLRGDLTNPAIQIAVLNVTGLAVPAPRRLSLQGARRAIWFSPDELLLIVAHSELKAIQGALTTALENVHSLVADISDARACFHLSGEETHLHEVVGRLMPIDMSDFKHLDVRRTRLGQIPAALWMAQPGSFDLVCFRSTARYAFDLLTQAAKSPKIF